AGAPGRRARERLLRGRERATCDGHPQRATGREDGRRAHVGGALSRVEEGYRLAAAITRARAKSFAFAANALDKDTRRAAFALYAFCRRCDDAVDASERGTPALRAEVDAAYAGDDLGDPILAAFGDTARARAVPRSLVLGLIEGMERDLGLVRHATWA